MNWCISGRWLRGLVWVLMAVPCLGNGEEGGGAGEGTAAEIEWVRELAETVRPSVVVVTHTGRDGKEEGLGSGFVISEDGLIATSLHVIGEARPIQVRLESGERLVVTEVHAWDRALDLAVIRVEADSLPALRLADSDALAQGTAVAAFGNPLGLEFSVVEGVVSARRDFGGAEMIQLAIPIEPGNSGGPLLDRAGKVHGVLTMKSMVSRNLGFAMSSNALRELLESPNPVEMSRWLTIGSLDAHVWEVVFDGKWTRRGGQLQAGGRGEGFGGRTLCLYRLEVPERPFEVGVSVKLGEERGAAGLVFDADGGDRHYGFYPSNGGMRLTRFDGPSVYTWNILEEVRTGAYRPGEWNRLKVRLEPDGVQCFVNGMLVIESTDRGLAAGRVGLAKFRDTEAAFRDFVVGSSVEGELGGVPEKVLEAARQTVGELDLRDEDLTGRLGELPEDQEGLTRVLREKAQGLEKEAERMRRLAGLVHARRIGSALEEVLGAGEEADLLEASLLLARLDDEELEAAPYEAQVERMAAEIRDGLAGEERAEAERVEAVLEYLFKESGFHGSRTDYGNAANSYMNDVLDDREGLPITLSVLVMELARRVGVTTMAGVGLPGHFVVKYRTEEGEDRWLDPFNQGRELELVDLDRLVVVSTGRRMREEDSEAATPRAIVGRMLRNLRSAAEKEEDWDKVQRYCEVAVAVEPESVVERFNRARARWMVKDKAGAKQDFEWLLEREPAGVDVERVREFLESL